MNRLIKWAAIAMGLIVIGLWLSGPVNLVVVRLPREQGRLLAAGRLSDGEYVSLTYRHSVELTEVEGRFKIGSGSELCAWQTRMSSVGTGLPNAFPERTVIKDGWAVIDEQMRPIGRFRFFIVPINKTKLRLGAVPVDLTALPTGALIELAVERPSRLNWLLWSTADRDWTSQGEAP